MNKKIGYVKLDPAQLAVLRKTDGLPGELQAALNELSAGQISSLMLALNDDALPTPDDTIHCGVLTILPRTRRVMRDGREIILTPKEFDILLFLARNRGEIFTKEQIYHAVWEHDYLLDDSNIMAFIRKLRKKIEPDPDAPRYILTIWGVGYKFTDEV